MADMMNVAFFEKPGVIKVKEARVLEISENEVLSGSNTQGSAEQSGASTTVGILLTDCR